MVVAERIAVHWHHGHSRVPPVDGVGRSVTYRRVGVLRSHACRLRYIECENRWGKKQMGVGQVLRKQNSIRPDKDDILDRHGNVVIDDVSDRNDTSIDSS